MLYCYIMSTEFNVKAAPGTPMVSDQALAVSSKLDKLAVALSSICMLHCLLAPLLFTLMPILALNVFWEDLLFHQLMLWLVLPTSAIALAIGCRKHRDWLILGTGVLGMLMLIAIAIAGHDMLSSWQEKLATSIAGLTLAVSHILNYRACQNQPCADQNCASKHHH